MTHKLLIKITFIEYKLKYVVRLWIITGKKFNDSTFTDLIVTQ